MKSSEEVRQRFKERIKEALEVVQDSDELTEALAIVEDLDELVEIQALAAEYFYHKNLSRVDYYGYDDDDDDYGQMHDNYNVKKLYEYLVHRMDLFLGVGIHGGVWRQSKHWIAVTVEKLAKKAEAAQRGFMGRHQPIAPTPRPSSNPFVTYPLNPTPAPVTPPKPPASTYLLNLQEILKKATSNNLTAIAVTHKTNGDFELKGAKTTVYLTHSYVPRTVTIKDDQKKKLKVFRETDLDLIAGYLEGLIV